MIHVVKWCVLDVEVIHNQSREGVLCVVLPESRRKLDRVVPKMGQMFHQGLMGYYACLFKVIRSFENFYIHKTFIVD